MLSKLYTPNAEFLVWSAQHYAWFVYALCSTLFWIYLGKKAPTPEGQQRVGVIMSMVGVFAWLLAEILMPIHDQMEIQSMLPLHLCYFMNLALPWMLHRRSFELFDIAYPILMAGCLQALFTPDLQSGFPHFHNLRYFFVHIGLVQMAVYAIAVFGFRPTFKGIFKCLLFFNVYAAVVTVFNLLLNTNFMYLREKPPGTMLDYFGEWPMYIIYGELLALTLFFIVWAPFGITGYLAKSRSSPDIL